MGDVQIVVFSMLLGALIAYPTAMARMSKNRLARGLSFAYVYFFRGTPILAQLFLIYAGLGTLFASYRGVFEEWGVWWILREGYYYVSSRSRSTPAPTRPKSFEAASNPFPRARPRAGEALGLHHGAIMRKIVLPQALIVGLRPLGNELILMIKASAVASIVTVYDVMGVTRLAFSGPTTSRSISGPR